MGIAMIRRVGDVSRSSFLSIYGLVMLKAVKIVTCREWCDGRGLE